MINEVFSKLPKTDFPGSHGFKGGNFVFTSSQVGTNPQTGKIAAGIEAQIQ